MENKILTAEEFNKKYKKYLEQGYYGLDLHKPEAIKYLDKQFQKFTKIPGFKYSQIKSKFGSFRFYNEGLSLEDTQKVEEKLKQIYE